MKLVHDDKKKKGKEKISYQTYILIFFKHLPYYFKTEVMCSTEIKKKVFKLKSCDFINQSGRRFQT